VRTLCCALAAAALAAFPAAGASWPAQDPAPGATRPSFSDFLNGIREEARTRGIREEVIQAALDGIDEPLPVILERDRTQAEIVLPLENYLDRRLTAKLIRTGREELAMNRALLASVSERYGVPPTVVLAVWGIESNFGRFSGVRPTVAALVTLAWDPRRSAFFRGELFDALEILNRGDIDLDRLRGSWAGAMGQTQFMPSSYLQFAEDFDGDGRRDIWTSTADVFASIANYLKAHGWQNGEPWGREVKVPHDVARRVTQTVARRDGACMATRNMTVAMPRAKWTELGVRTLRNGALPKNFPDSYMVSGSARYFLVSANYDALLAYNCAHSYAISVGLLADQVGSSSPLPKAKKKKHHGSRNL
jgi:membrane-bound lytic murein transglycosylase B